MDTFITPEVVSAVKGAYSKVEQELERLQLDLDKERAIIEHLNTHYIQVKKLHTAYKLFLAQYESAV